MTRRAVFLIWELIYNPSVPTADSKQDLNILSPSRITLEVNSVSPILGKEEMTTFKLKHVMARAKAPYSTLYHEKVREGMGECVSVCLSFLTESYHYYP